jgi:hypothetical protein
MLAGWYWHHQSQRPVYVYQGGEGWHARYPWIEPDQPGSTPPAGTLNNVSVDLPLELYLELVPLFRRASIATERRRAPAYPLVLPCQHCGTLTPSSFMPVGDGTWIARPVCDVHQDTG